jgi:hypothetical protein
MAARAYFNGFDPMNAVMGSHRNIGRRHVSILDDHDRVFGEKIRFSREAASEYQVIAGVALQLFTLGIPCIYAGTKQALAGPELSERKWLLDSKGSDRYLREAMFGPWHPRQSGVAGLQAFDQNLLTSLWAVWDSGCSLFRSESPCLCSDCGNGGTPQKVSCAALGTTVFATNRDSLLELALWRSRTEWRNYWLVTGFRR